VPPVQDQLRHAVRADAGEAELLALLEAKARLGAKCEPVSCTPDAHRVEHGRLDRDLGRRVRYLAVRATHDPRDADRALRVRDDQRLGAHLAHDVVEGLQLLAGLGAPDDDGSVVYGGPVESVRGLAELEHDVIGRVHDVADRAHSGRLEAHLDPVRRGADLRSADPATHETRAELGLADVHAQMVGHRAARLVRLDPGPAHPPTRGGGHLPRETDQAERVAAVRLHVHVEHDVAVELGQVATQRDVGRQDEDAFGVARDAQLVAGAEHALRRDAHLLGLLDAPIARQDGAGQRDGHALSGSDVVRAAHDVQRLARPDRDRREMEPVRVRMVLDAEELAHHHRAPVGAPLFDLLHLHAQQGEAFRELLWGEVDVDVVAEPVERDSHRNCSRKRRSFSR